MSAATSINNYEYLDILDRAWRLPLSLLAPAALFSRIRHNLAPQGLFLMVNHGEEGATLANELCIAAGLVFAARWADPTAPGSHRSKPPVVSWWRCP